jgi:hypothetical protein
MAMTPKQLWIKELREGDHRQTHLVLQDSNGFCCLGVACLVYERETGNKLPRDNAGQLFHANLGKSCTHDYTPVQEWLGLRTTAADIFNSESLACMNDHGKTFAEIADVIESEPEGLFI